MFRSTATRNGYIFAASLAVIILIATWPALGNSPRRTPEAKHEETAGKRATVQEFWIAYRGAIRQPSAGRPRQAVESYQRALKIQNHLEDVLNYPGNRVVEPGASPAARHGAGEAASRATAPGSSDQMRAIYRWGLIIVIGLPAGGCNRETELDAETAGRLMAHRSLGLAYLEEDNLSAAEAEFLSMLDIAPREPLGHANLGLTYLRMEQYDQAESRLDKAFRLNRADPDIGILLALVYDFTNRADQALRTLQKVHKRHPQHVRTNYKLAQYHLGGESQSSREIAEGYLAQVVAALPANAAARIQLLELLLRNGKHAEAVQHIELLRQSLPALPGGAAELLRRSLELIAAGEAEQSLTPAIMFHNLLKQTTFFQGALKELTGAAGPIAGEPIYRFSRVLSPRAETSSRVREALVFTVVSGTALETGSRKPVAGRVVLALGDFDQDGDQDLFVSRPTAAGGSTPSLFANRDGLFAGPLEATGIAHPGRDIAARFADFNNDGRLDLFITNTAGNRLYRNEGEGRFRDISAAAGLLHKSGGLAVLFADLDLEGDLDLLIAGPGGNLFYRNNADGRFTELAEEAGIDAAGGAGRDVALGDFDNDGDIDLVVADARAGLRLYENLRQGFFWEVSAYTGLGGGGGADVVAVGDYNNDGYLDLYVSGTAPGRHTLYRNQGDGAFLPDTLAPAMRRDLEGFDSAEALFFDADNDGFLDLLLAGSGENSGGEPRGVRLYYNDGSGSFYSAPEALPRQLAQARQLAISDYDSDGDLDIIVAGDDGRVYLLRNDGGNVHNYLSVRLAALRSGSSKNNYYGIGATVEVNAGSLYQMRVMDSPVAHFGLGNRDRAEVLRVIWSNGVQQVRTNPEQQATVMESQILKGSCPYLFAWDGAGFGFVTDVLWASALGMPLGIMAGEPVYAFPNSTDEYMFVPGERLRARDGKYLLQFTTELWETAYLDQVRLLLVDHPDSVAVVIDEKFTVPPWAPFRVYALGEIIVPLSARDGAGNDLLPRLAAADGDYLRHLVPGDYQGITESHDLILDPGDLSAADSVFLFLKGWVFPSDASINVNVGQSRTWEISPPALQVLDGNGEWVTVLPNIGFPKGKDKTVVVDLTGKFRSPDRRVRIRSNMQIYWDQAWFATGTTAGPVRITRLAPLSADLHFRGFSALSQRTPYSPHIPDYKAVSAEARWRDLAGMVTRYGAVHPLLQSSDNRVVIMNAGDELSLAFDASLAPQLPDGWRRDFIFYNDGWLKDGDLNTAHGQTVAPLPYHGMSAYPYGPNDAYPGDQALATYRQTYNTRQVDGSRFARSMINLAAGSGP